MKVVAYVVKYVPVIAEIDDKWKKMEKWANEPTCEELDDYHDDNIEEFEEEIGTVLKKMGESDYDLTAVHTLAGNEIFKN